MDTPTKTIRVMTSAEGAVDFVAGGFVVEYGHLNITQKYRVTGVFAPGHWCSVYEVLESNQAKSSARG